MNPDKRNVAIMALFLNGWSHERRSRMGLVSGGSMVELGEEIGVLVAGYR